MIMSYALALRKCFSLSQGKLLHSNIIKEGLANEQQLANLLIQMYTRCGILEDGKTAFDILHEKNVYSWNFLLLGYAENGRSHEVLQLFRRMDIPPNEITFKAVIPACASLKCLSQAREIYASVLENNLDTAPLCKMLLKMFTRCGSLGDARQVFERMQAKDVICYTCMITMCARFGQPDESLRIFHRLDAEGLVADGVTLLAVVGACSDAQELVEGRKVHERIVASGHASNVTVLNSLMNMYSRFNLLEQVQRLFQGMMPWQRTVVSWTTMISAYAKGGQPGRALSLYHEMNSEGILLDEFVFVTLADACSLLGSLENGKKIHACMSHARLDSDVVPGNSLINMYSKCRRTDLAKRVFDGMSIRDSVSWTSMITGYVQQHRDREAVELFQEMVKVTKPTEVTFVNVLSACSNIESLRHGREVHAHVTASGMELRGDVSTGLVSMYTRCRRSDDAKSVFDKACGLPSESLWNAMIITIMHDGEYKQALELFHRMDLEGVKPEQFTFSSAITACSFTNDLKQGVRLHQRYLQSGLPADSILESCLVNMYAKCGSLHLASRIFEDMEKRDVLSWSTLIGGYAQHGHGTPAVNLFHRMILEGFKPSEVTFLSTMYACGHVGLVEKAREYMVSMAADHGAQPGEEHYRCMLDLLGRAGWLHEAEDLLNNMPFQCNATAWMSFLTACSTQSNPERAALAAEQAALDLPTLSAPYILLSNITGLSTSN